MNENHSVTDRTLDLPLGRGEMLPFVREMAAYVCHCCCLCVGDSTVQKGVLGWWVLKGWTVVDTVNWFSQPPCYFLSRCRGWKVNTLHSQDSFAASVLWINQVLPIKCTHAKLEGRSDSESIFLLLLPLASKVIKMWTLRGIYGSWTHHFTV